MIQVTIDWKEYDLDKWIMFLKKKLNMYYKSRETIRNEYNDEAKELADHINEWSCE